MKINLVLPTLAHSGGVQVALEYMNYFSKRGNDVICYVPITGPYYGLKKAFFLKTIIHVCISKDFFDNIRGKWFNSNFRIKFVSKINNFNLRNADVTIATSWITSYWVSNLNEGKGKKVYFIQDYETWGSNRENELVKKSYTLPFDLRITVSSMLHDKIWNLFNVDSEILFNGISEKYIKYRKVKTKNLILGFPYRRSRGKNNIKNSSFAIEALEDFSKYNDIEIKSFGFIKPKNWPDNIKFLENPNRDQLFDWYDKIDIFYVPSLYEGWGLPAMEAMARGCIVIASNTGCIYEFGKHKINCYKLKNMRNKKALSKALNYLINTDELEMQNISNEAVKTIKNYSFNTEAEKFISLLKSIIRKG